MANLRRLPGIQVDVAPPPAAEALPRMDVAVFVGFASTGPLHLPVAIESPSQYATVFGADARLAWDARRGERVVAHLGASVRAFFANGGRRCWVIRVAHTAWTEALRSRPAGEPAPAVAIANRFAVPGVLAIPPAVSPTAGVLAPAALVARCEGAWSDTLTLSIALQRRGLAVEAWSAGASPADGRYSFDCRQPLRVGDLLQIGSDSAICAYLRVEQIAAGSAPSTPYRVEARLLAAFERVILSVSPDTIVGTARVGDNSFDTLATLHLDATSSAAGAVRLEFDEALPATVWSGHWARFDAGTQTLWMRIDEIERRASANTSPPSSGTEAIVSAVSGPAWRVLDDTAIALLEPLVSAQALEIELRVASEQGPVARLRGLGLTPERPTNVWEQQVDGVFYRQRDDLSAIAPEDLQRFPLAAEDTTPPEAWLPLGVDSLFGAAMPPSHQDATALERDGLATFDSTLFLDPELALDSVDGLLAHADDIRLIRENTRSLSGLHAVFGIGAGGVFSETSLLAMPDAVHLGWRRREDEIDAVGEPLPPAPPAHWRTHRGACSQVADAASDAAEQDQSTLSEPDFGTFLDCTTRRIDAPMLEGPDAPVRPGPYRLTWTQVEPAAQYALFEATLVDFSDEREIYRGVAAEYVAMSQREGLYRYRVFAHVGAERSAGSNPIAVRVRAEEWVQYEPENGDLFEAEWLAIHRAALRMAAASGDLFVALSMPRHFETAQALRYTQRLRAVRQPPDIADAQAFGFNEARALSYGAMYFPWLLSETRNKQTSTGVKRGNPAIPPDGVAVGVLAARASVRGAWIAAANESMKDVVALTPLIPAGDWQALQDAQINLLRNDPRGFFALSADTLALDAELRLINVRRLLILLRRMALRRGTMYVFEPNGPVLRRSIQRGFDLLLTELFNRGAFAGATPAQSFRVVTDEGVNPRGSVDAGRLFVELRVAPSLPMRFIAVRLAQSGERLSVVEEL